MTDCDPPKIRSLIEKHLGKDKAKEYDTVVNSCKLGNALKDERTWAPLCNKYPNLKGVTCEEIDDCISIGETTVPEYIYTEDHCNMVKTLERYDPKESLTDKQEDANEKKFVRSYTENVISNMDSEPTRQQTRLIDNAAHDIFWTSMRSPDIFDNNFYYDTYYTLELDPTEEKPAFKDKYFRNVKVYDRDEEYLAFKKIGEQIENDYPGILQDLSTIFVTTPRGGHEMLSIFAYANDIDKLQIPSNMTEEDSPEDIRGKNWVSYTSSDEIRNIFIVDDIIASGQQIDITAELLTGMFPHAKINSITLCKRDDVPEETGYPVPKNIKYYTDTITSGMEKFRYELERDIPITTYITCLFPHACPDGDADKLMIELMGGHRCPPEKRISRRDL